MTRSGAGSPSGPLPETALAPTIRAALADAARALERAGVEAPRLDAELLLAEALGVDRARLVLDAGSPLPEAAAERFAGLIERRAEREPVAYILGRRDFRHITLAVDRRVLIPRPETELLVEVAAALPVGSRVVDVGTGSGAVALALKHERPGLEVAGTDLSEGALAVARANAERLGLAVAFLNADLLEGFEGRIDAVVANLPYVSDAAPLQPEIVRYEPARALYAGGDGLDVIRRLVAALDGVPFAALEVGADQAGAVASLLRASGYERVEMLADLAGLDRVVLARR
jgi:release factor glutamine methyltransferase